MADDRLIVALDYPSVIRLAFTRSEWSYSTPKEQKQFAFYKSKTNKYFLI